MGSLRLLGPLGSSLPARRLSHVMGRAAAGYGGHITRRSQLAHQSRQQYANLSPVHSPRSIKPTGTVASRCRSTGTYNTQRGCRSDDVSTFGSGRTNRIALSDSLPNATGTAGEPPECTSKALFFRIRCHPERRCQCPRSDSPIHVRPCYERPMLVTCRSTSCGFIRPPA